MRYKIRVTLKNDVISPHRPIDGDGMELDEALVNSGGWLVNSNWLSLGGANRTVMIPIQNIAFIELIPLPGAHK
jgi:hypothetical protein